ncbi:multidrug resistance protein MdtA [Rubritalea halochordaticola]|uniref:Multidrug resistance protein MdtA n=1 Tax=Rubritalea halochordaticola TaxID=714537 RepID=A0ABP9V408_9BACT
MIEHQHPASHQSPRPRWVRHLALLAITSASLTAPSLAQEQPKPVVVTKAEKLEGLESKITLTGTVTSPRRSRLSSRTDGLINKLNVDAGHTVKKGDVLMELDTKLGELALSLIEAEQEQAEIELANAKRLVDEAESLAKSGAFPKSEAITLSTNLRIAETKLKQLIVRKGLQEERIARHKLVAPFDGIIGQKLSEAGEWVATGTPVLELVEMTNLRFDIQVPQEFIGRVKGAESATITLDAFPNKTLEAKLSYVVPVKNAISRTFLTRLSITDTDGIAGPGMSGTATLAAHHKNGQAVQIPRDAVVRFPDGSAKVWIVQQSDSGSTVVSRIIKTTGELGVMAKVTEGLDGGETLVLKGNEGLQDNQAVNILPEKEPTK